MIDTIIKYVNDLFTLAPAPFTVIVVITFGYMLRGIKRVNNDWIPTVNHLVGTSVYVFLNMQKMRPDMGRTEFLVRVLFTGLIISYAAWKFHENILAGLEDKVPFLRTWINRGTKTEPQIEPPKP